MMPLKLAIGAPSITTLLGLAEVIRQSRNSIFLKVQSSLAFRNLNVELGPRNRELGQLRDVWADGLEGHGEGCICG